MAADEVSSDLIDLYRYDAQLCEDGVLITKHTGNPAFGPQQALFKRQRHLGSGGFSDVWLYASEPTERAPAEHLAVKKISKGQMRSQDYDYRREIEALALFSKHDQYFVKFEGWYEDPEYLFVATEFIEHGDLSAWIHRGLTELDAQTITLQILNALDQMHKREYAHRDIKPQNIFVASPAPNWWIKLADFGIAKRRSNEMTAFRTVVGTCGFWAPEVSGEVSMPDLEEEEEYTKAVDMWSLGCVAFNMLTKTVPFPKYQTDIRRFCKGQTDPVIKVLRDNSASEDAISFVMGLLRPVPSDRYDTCAALESPWVAIHRHTIGGAKLAGESAVGRVHVTDTGPATFLSSAQPAKYATSIQGLIGPMAQPAQVTSKTEPISRVRAQMTSESRSKKPSTSSLTEHTTWSTVIPNKNEPSAANAVDKRHLSDASSILTIDTQRESPDFNSTHSLTPTSTISSVFSIPSEQNTQIHTSIKRKPVMRRGDSSRPILSERVVRPVRHIVSTPTSISNPLKGITTSNLDLASGSSFSQSSCMNTSPTSLQPPSEDTFNSIRPRASFTSDRSYRLEGTSFPTPSARPSFCSTTRTSTTASMSSRNNSLLSFQTTNSLFTPRRGRIFVSSIITPLRPKELAVWRKLPVWRVNDCCFFTADSASTLNTGSSTALSKTDTTDSNATTNSQAGSGSTSKAKAKSKSKQKDKSKSKQKDKLASKVILPPEEYTLVPRSSPQRMFDLSNNPTVGLRVENKHIDVLATSTSILLIAFYRHEPTRTIRAFDPKDELLIGWCEITGHHLLKSSTLEGSKRGGIVDVDVPVFHVGKAGTLAKRGVDAGKVRILGREREDEMLVEQEQEGEEEFHLDRTGPEARSASEAETDHYLQDRSHSNSYPASVSSSSAGPDTSFNVRRHPPEQTSLDWDVSSLRHEIDKLG